MAKRVSRRVCLTYQSDQLPDGAGAQLQRIAAVYGIAEKFSLGYLHSPLSDISWNPGDGMGAKEDRIAQIRSLNEKFILPNTFPHQSFDKELTVKNMGIRAFLSIVFALMLRRSTLVRVENPYPLADQLSGTYDHAGRQWAARFEKDKATAPSGSHTRVAVHIRRAVNPRFDKRGRRNPRFQEPGWYTNVLLETMKVFELSEADIQIHTDLPISDAESPIVIPSEALHNSGPYWSQLGLEQGKAEILPPKDAFQNFFNRFSDSEIVLDLNPSDAIEMMARADIFVGAKSSMSFVVGLLRGNRPTVFPSFWHRLPKNWIAIEDNAVKVPKSKSLGLLLNERLR